MNGFDNDDLSFKSVSQPTPKFIITYSGSLQRGRTPLNLLEAASDLLKKGLIDEDDFEIRIVGAADQRVLEHINKYDSLKIVNFIGYVSHEESVAYLSETTVLLLILGEEEGLMPTTGKIFEYLAARKPILGLVPPKGEAANLINRANAGRVVALEDKAGIYDVVLDLYTSFKNGNLTYEGKEEVIEEFDRKKLTEKLVAVLDEALGE